MNFFDEATLRLKQQLKVTEDKQVAETLGMTGSAWTKRKTRGAFPEKELRALVQRRPELGIDVGYVLTGQSTKVAVAKAVLNMGSRFKEIRGARSVEEFAQLLGTTPQTISNIEAQSQLPTTELLRNLVDAHPDKDVAWLWGGESPKLDGPLTGIEAILVMNYRASSKEGQASIRRMAAFHATYHEED